MDILFWISQLQILQILPSEYSLLLIMNPAMYINEWQCSINILNATVYRKFQHASLHNPMKNTNFTLPKKNSTFREKNHGLFKNSTQYKLPVVQTYRKKLRQSKQNISKDSETHTMSKKPTFKNILTPLRESMDKDPNNNSQFTQKLRRFREKVEGVFNFGERDKYFSYFCRVVSQICVSIQDSENKQQKVNNLVIDLELLTKNIDRNRSVLNTLKKITVFKRNSQYFQFKLPQIKVLYHILLAQLEFYGKEFDKTIKELQFCQYYSRKQGLESLTLSFLWQMANLNISQSKYESADENLRNLLEMAVICKQKKALKYAFEKISLLYYYRGNSIMGQYYLKKSESGLTPFEIEMYFKQYSYNDEIKRLEQKLFYLPVEEPRVKRKNNPKIQSDVWKQSKEDHEKNMDKYMESINQMLKDHEHAKLGRQIKKIARKVNFLGFKTKKSQTGIQNCSAPLKQLTNRKTFAPQKGEEKQGNYTARKSLNEEKNQQKFQKMKQLSQYSVQENITNVIKTHLSMNRQNIRISRQQRWRKCISFIFTLESELREMVQGGPKQNKVVKTEARLKTSVNQSRMIE